ncbi:MAG TPA: hypothetical protein VGJ48_08890 [Pyrinomonadaceae bacterium]
MIKSYRWSLKGTFAFLVALTLLSGVMVFAQHTRRRKVPAATVATKQFPLTDRALEMA